MFWMERYHYEFVLSPAFRLYDGLLKYYYEVVLNSSEDQAKVSCYSMLWAVRENIIETQKERSQYFDQMQKELESWDTSQMLQTLEERGAQLQCMTNTFFRDEKIFQSSWVTNTQSLSYIIPFLEPAKEEDRYIIGWIKRLIGRLGNDISGDQYTAFRVRSALETSISKITGQEELLAAWETSKKEYKEEMEHVWLEVMFTQALKRIQGDKYWQFWDIWS